MMFEISLAQMLIDAAVCRIEVRFQWIPYDQKIPSLAVTGQWLNPRTEKWFAKQVSFDLAYIELAQDKDEFIRSRVADLIAELLRNRNGVCDIPDDVRKRWSL